MRPRLGLIALDTPFLLCQRRRAVVPLAFEALQGPFQLLRLLPGSLNAYDMYINLPKNKYIYI